MQSSLTSAYGPWLEPLSVMTVGVVVIVGLAALAARQVRTPVWQRTIWQGATLGLLVLVLAEMTGGSSALVELAQAPRKPSSARWPNGRRKRASPRRRRPTLPRPWCRPRYALTSLR